MVRIVTDTARRTSSNSAPCAARRSVRTTSAPSPVAAPCSAGATTAADSLAMAVSRALRCRSALTSPTSTIWRWVKTTPARRRGQVYRWGRNDPYQHLGWEGSGRRYPTPRLNNVNGVFSRPRAQSSLRRLHPDQIWGLTGSFAGAQRRQQPRHGLGVALRDAGTCRRATKCADGPPWASGHDKLAGRWNHCCAPTSTGSFLGPGNDNDTDSLVRAGQLVEVTEIAAGAYHTCARDDAGAIYCWGTNGQGSLGIAGNDRSTPTRLQTF